MPELNITKEKYYVFSHTKTYQKYITICLLQDEQNNIARGMSICSKEDEFFETEGKERAYQHALKALKNRKAKEVKDHRAIGMLVACNCPFDTHGEKNPKLTWKERRLLFGRKKMYEVNERGRTTNDISCRGIKFNSYALPNGIFTVSYTV